MRATAGTGRTRSKFDPNPRISRTGSRDAWPAGTGWLAGEAAARPLTPAEVTGWSDAAATFIRLPSLPSTKASRVRPITRAIATTVAIGASGTGSHGQRGSGCRAGLRAAMATRPNQARALATPARPDTGTATHSGRLPITAATTDSRAKSASSQYTARTGGSVRHQNATIPPCDSGSETSSMATSEARKGQENGRMATPTVSETVGDSSRQAAMVRVAADRNAIQGEGLASPAGQASRISAAFSADRTTITAVSSRAKSNQGRLYP